MSDDKGVVLVVDDDPLNRAILSRGLERDGHVVRTVATGEEALASLRDDPADVVLLDVVMPGMDGVQVLEELKGDASLRDVPVIMISALDDYDHVVRCIELGAEDYLPKPFDPVLLRARVNAGLTRARLNALERDAGARRVRALPARDRRRRRALPERRRPAARRRPARRHGRSSRISAASRASRRGRRPIASSTSSTATSRR